MRCPMASHLAQSFRSFTESISPLRSCMMALTRWPQTMSGGPITATSAERAEEPCLRNAGRFRGSGVGWKRGSAPWWVPAAGVGREEQRVEEDHRITEWSGLAGTSVGHPAQPPAQAGSPTVGCRGPCPGGS